MSAICPPTHSEKRTPVLGANYATWATAETDALAADDLVFKFVVAYLENVKLHLARGYADGIDYGAIFLDAILRYGTRKVAPETLETRLGLI